MGITNLSDTTISSELKASLLKSVKQRLEHVISTPSLALMAAAVDPRHGHLGFVSDNVRDEVWKCLQEETIQLAETNSFTELIAPSFAILRRTLENNKQQLQNINPLHFWRDETSKLSCLHSVTKMLLAIPASSASSERVFSATGFIHNERRATLTDDHVEDMVVFIRENFNWKEKDQLMNELKKLLEETTS